jgi:hypothetical protein
LQKRTGPIGPVFIFVVGNVSAQKSFYCTTNVTAVPWEALPEVPVIVTV